MTTHPDELPLSATDRAVLDYVAAHTCTADDVLDNLAGYDPSEARMRFTRSIAYLTFKAGRIRWNEADATLTVRGVWPEPPAVDAGACNW